MYYQNYEDYMRQVLGYPINDPNIYETYDYRNDLAYEDTYSSRNQMMTGMSEEEMKSCYPDIYHLVYPMVCKVCETNSQPLTRELIEKMTDEVYMAIEDTTTTVNIRVEAPSKVEENRSANVSSLTPNSTTKSNNTIRSLERSGNNIRRESRVSRVEGTRTTKAREDRNAKEASAKIVDSAKSIENAKNIVTDSKSQIMENREVAQNRESRHSNSNLRDLIKILLLNRLLGNRPGNSRPPRPPKPPFPVRPNRPPYPGGPGMPPPRPIFQI